MKTIVEICWDTPEEQYWLCADNIAVALSAYCPNTQFKVRALADDYMLSALTATLPFLPHAADGSKDVLHPVLGQVRAAIARAAEGRS